MLAEVELPFPIFRFLFPVSFRRALCVYVCVCVCFYKHWGIKKERGPTDVSQQIISDRAEDLCMRVNGLK